MKIDLYDLFTVYDDERSLKHKNTRLRAIKKKTLENIGAASPTAQSSRRMRPFAAVAAGLAAAAAFTVTVGAVSGWDFRVMISSLFGAESEDSISDKLTDISLKEYRSTFDELDFNFLGAVNDDNISTIFFEVIRTDGGVFDAVPALDLPESKRETIDDETLSMLNADIAGLPAYNINCYLMVYQNIKNGSCGKYHNARTLLIDDEDAYDNKLTFALCFDTGDLSGFMEGDTADVEIDMRSLKENKWVIRNVFKNSETGAPYSFMETRTAKSFDGMMTAKLSVGLKKSPKRTAEPNVKITLPTDPVLSVNENNVNVKNEEHDFTLTSVSISSVSINMQFLTEKSRNPLYITRGADFAKLMMKDGTSIVIDCDNKNITRENRYRKTGEWLIIDSYVFGKVIDINDVAAVVINGTEIPI